MSKFIKTVFTDFSTKITAKFLNDFQDHVLSLPDPDSILTTEPQQFSGTEMETARQNIGAAGENSIPYIAHASYDGSNLTFRETYRQIMAANGAGRVVILQLETPTGKHSLLLSATSDGADFMGFATLYRLILCEIAEDGRTYYQEKVI